jgi:hypothetical protein
VPDLFPTPGRVLTRTAPGSTLGPFSFSAQRETVIIGLTRLRRVIVALDPFRGEVAMINSLFWWSGLLLWAGVGISGLTLALAEAHDRSILRRSRAS